MTNPLEKYYRAPKIYTQLPSRMQFYAPEMVETTPNGEVAIYSMTALDQIIIRTPDALLNGDALLKVVQNCVPAIKDPINLVEPDINALLLAIRIASKGPNMTLDVVCGNCQHENHYEIDCQAILETQTPIETVNSLDIDGKLLLHVKPYNFHQRNLTLLNEIQETQAIKLLESNEQMDETAKMIELGNLVTKMATRTLEIVAKSITHITIIATGQTVSDPAHINEFVRNISKEQADAIMERIKELNNTGIDSKCNFTCQECQHEWTQPLDFDPSSFFG
jgi:hypothetical protein